MKKRKNLGFTLIELLVVITIIFILSVAVYTPFAYAQTKQKVTNSAKLVNQVLYQARNLAINGSVDITTSNVSVGIFLQKGKDEIVEYHYPHTLSLENISTLTDSQYKKKVYALEDPITILNEDELFVYEAITGSWYYSESTSPIEIIVWIESTGALSKTIQYYPRTYIGDIQ